MQVATIKKDGEDKRFFSADDVIKYLDHYRATVVNEEHKFILGQLAAAFRSIRDNRREEMN